MPTRSWPLWLLTASLLIAFPILNFIYWPLVLQSGVLPPEADSIGIPMFGSVFVAVVASPIMIGVSWLCLRRYNAATRLTAMRRDRPYRTASATLIFGGLATLLLFGAVAEALTGPPWYEWLCSAYTALWVAWMLAMRASLIEQHSPADL